MQQDDKFDEKSWDKIQELKNDVLILIATVTDEETRAVHSLLKSPNGLAKPILVHREINAYYVGIFGNYLAVNVQSKQGGSGIYAATSVISQAIMDWSPKAVIMPGIAFGADEKKQKLKDIIVSEAIRDYTYGKIQGIANEDSLWGSLVNFFTREVFFSRGREMPSGHILHSKFLAHNLNRSKELPKTHFGLVLSANVLLNSMKKKKQLAKKYDDMIGGEMEGHVLANLCSAKRIEWIVAKSICDWGDGKKKDIYHDECALVSAILCCDVLKQHTSFEALGVRSVVTLFPPMIGASSGLLHLSEYDSSLVRTNNKGGITRNNLEKDIYQLFELIKVGMTDFGISLIKDVDFLVAEYISNLIEHSGAEEINYLVNDKKIIISDNGKAFNPMESEVAIPSNSTRGYGVSLIKKIALENNSVVTFSYHSDSSRNYLEIIFPSKIKGGRSFSLRVESNDMWSDSWIEKVKIPDDAVEIVLVSGEMIIVSGWFRIIQRLWSIAKERRIPLILECKREDKDYLDMFLKRIDSKEAKNSLVIRWID